MLIGLTISVMTQEHSFAMQVPGGEPQGSAATAIVALLKQDKPVDFSTFGSELQKLGFEEETNQKVLANVFDYLKGQYSSAQSTLTTDAAQREFIIRLLKGKNNKTFHTPWYKQPRTAAAGIIAAVAAYDYFGFDGEAGFQIHTRVADWIRSKISSRLSEDNLGMCFDTREAIDLEKAGQIAALEAARIAALEADRAAAAAEKAARLEEAARIAALEAAALETARLEKAARLEEAARIAALEAAALEAARAAAEKAAHVNATLSQTFTDIKKHGFSIRDIVEKGIKQIQVEQDSAPAVITMLNAAGLTIKKTENVNIGAFGYYLSRYTTITLN